MYGLQYLERLWVWICVNTWRYINLWLIDNAGRALRELTIYTFITAYHITKPWKPTGHLTRNRFLNDPKARLIAKILCDGLHVGYNGKWLDGQTVVSFYNRFLKSQITGYSRRRLWVVWENFTETRAPATWWICCVSAETIRKISFDFECRVAPLCCIPQHRHSFMKHCKFLC